MISSRAWLALFAAFAHVSASCGYGTILQPRDAQGPVAVNNFGYIGSKGPAGWAALDPVKNALCAKGTAQSPINLIGGVTRSVPKGQLSFFIPDMTKGADFENLGTTVEVMAEGGKLSLAGTQYTLRQFHFHLPSEHLDHGLSMAMEMHMVWEADGGKIAVIAAFVDIPDSPTATKSTEPRVACGNIKHLSATERRALSQRQQDSSNETIPELHERDARYDVPKKAAPKASALLQTVLGNVDKIAQPGTRIKTPPLVMSELVNVLSSGEFVTYQGSLTTPPCKEGVQWLISNQVLFIPVSVYDKARAVIGFNSRFPQNAPGQPNALF